MSQESLLIQMAERLDASGIPYMVVGSHGSSVYGMPRTTYDIDVVIDPVAPLLISFVRSLAVDFYVSEAAVREALDRRSMFNVIELESGMKVDFVIRKNRPFSVEEFGRRQLKEVQGRSIAFASAEDIVLTKLEWDKITSSERPRNDARDVAALQWNCLDLAYMRRWAVELGISDSLEQVLRDAEFRAGGVDFGDERKTT